MRAELQQQPDLPLLDHRAMSDWCDDLDKADVIAVLARVPEEGRRSIEEIRRAVEAGDFAAAKRIAHRLKGMAGNLGAARLAQIARSMEIASQSLGDISSQLALLDKTLAETLEAIDAYA